MNFGREDYNRRIIDLDRKIPESMPVFFLKGDDLLAPALLLEWAKQLRLAGGDPNMAKSAEDHAQCMIDWQRENGCKTPDMYQDSPERKRWRSELKSLIEGYGVLEFDKVEGLVEKIYGSKSLLYIFTTIDLLNNNANRSYFEELTESDLKIEDPDRYEKCEIALFITRSGHKTIKSKL